MLGLNYKYFPVLIILFFTATLPTPVAAEMDPKKMDWRLLIEPSFAYPPIAWPIIGAQQTVIVPARMVAGIPSYLTREDNLQIGLSRQEIEEIALKNATDTLKQLEPKFIRNSEGVILYAILESDQLLTASTVLSPQFEKLFENIMGSHFSIAIPNRFRIYIFPRVFAPMPQILDKVAMDFRATAYPVSKEIFTLHKGVLSCLGAMAR